MENLLIQFLSFLLLSSFSCCLATNFSINCGGSNLSLGNDWTFVGDEEKSDSFSVSDGKSVHNNSVLPEGTSPLYQTARIFKKQKSNFYEFTIADHSIYLVRLHFFTFNPKQKTDFSNALFHVSASKLLLLSNFRVENTTNSLVIREFFLNIDVGKFQIFFTPANEASFAFVSAIQVLFLPNNFIMDDNSTAVPPLGTANVSFSGKALNTLYRINIGGSEVNETDDPFRRKWLEDDQYLIASGASEDFSYSGNLNQISSSDANKNIIEDIAPDIVYKTCKRIKNGSLSNITWRFDVRKKAMHLVRLHFCDIISSSPGILQFDLYIYSKFRQVIRPNLDFGTEKLAAPFLNDYVVESDDSGYINISIAPNEDSEIKSAYLNGLEIMEFVTNKSNPFPNTPRSKPIDLIIGFSVGGLVLISILIILFWFGAKYRKAKAVRALVLKDEVPIGKGRPHSWIAATSATNSASPVPNLNLKLKMPFSEILAATNNFDSKLLIGEGGFGKVYKGNLSTGIKVAVKRSDSSHGQGLPEFQTEVTVLSKIRHRHLVSLIGYCDEGSEMILVYEFMEKGTLRDHLYSWKENSKNATTKTELTWKQRLEICIGAAKGLHYLHTGSDGGIIHRDVKSTNILLDEYYVAKVADFGLSETGHPDPDHYRMGLIGSFGYLDPEYFRTLQLTDKSDVYSFGVVLLEVLCARPPIVKSSMRDEINLAEWGMFWQGKGQLEKIIDPLLAGQINPYSLRKFGEIAEKCLKAEGANRPTMLDVCWDLEYALQLQQTAVHREPHEDSTTDVSSNFVLPMSSNSFPSEEHFGDYDDSKLEFSRTMIDEAS